MFAEYMDEGGGKFTLSYGGRVVTFRACRGPQREVRPGRGELALGLAEESNSRQRRKDEGDRGVPGRCGLKACPKGPLFRGDRCVGGTLNTPRINHDDRVD